MRFLIDESLPRALARALVLDGHDAIDARDIGLRGATDDDVAAAARKDRRVLLSGDVDFANALRFPPGSHPGIVVARLPDTWRSSRRVARIVQALADVGQRQVSGAITILESGRVRILNKPRSQGH